MEDDREPRARGKRPPQGEPVIDRALSLLSAFDAGQRRLSLAELSRRTGIPVSSTLRLAGHLVRWGALERDEGGRYCLGLRLLEVASLAPRGHGLRQVAMPFMSDLAEVTRQHVHLAVREGTEATLVEGLSAHQAAPVQYRIGGRLPLHSTAVGLVLLAFAPAGLQEEFLARPMPREPDHVLIPPEVMRRTLADVRRERLAIYRRQEQAGCRTSKLRPSMVATLPYRLVRWSNNHGAVHSGRRSTSATRTAPGSEARTRTPGSGRLGRSSPGRGVSRAGQTGRCARGGAPGAGPRGRVAHP
jgi:DNA-binding IclR family transcriptional regulator